jgi:hypothetical protein
MKTAMSELMNFLSDSGYQARYGHAKATKTCALCEQPARTFRNASGKLEYSVSALCQKCQDRCFGK